MPSVTSHKGYDFGEITDRFLKCAIAVHKEFGPYFMETTYQVALALELQSEGLEFDRECWMDIHYKGHKVDTRRVDFLSEDVLVETKAKKSLQNQDHIQTLGYLKASGYQVGLLINFGADRIQVKRFETSKSFPKPEE